MFEDILDQLEKLALDPDLKDFVDNTKTVLSDAEQGFTTKITAIKQELASKEVEISRLKVSNFDALMRTPTDKVEDDNPPPVDMSYNSLFEWK